MNTELKDKISKQKKEITYIIADYEIKIDYIAKSLTIEIEPVEKDSNAWLCLDNPEEMKELRNFLTAILEELEEE